VRIIVPLVPGGTTDAVARVVAEPLSRAIGQPVVVENRAGANGWIANDYVMRERPDGHTLIVNNVSTHAINSAAPPADRQLTPARGLVPIAHLGETPQVILVPGNFPASTMAEFIERARAAETAPLVFASAGVGSYQHIDMELFARRAGITLTHLPLRGAGEMVTTALRGDAQLAEFNLITAQQHLQTGRLRALAVVARERIAQLPDVPTTAEVGFPELTTTLWNGLFAPGGTPERSSRRCTATSRASCATRKFPAGWSGRACACAPRTARPSSAPMSRPRSRAGPRWSVSSASPLADSRRPA
jgi:tripartite-type tricarboxylate transporter receptor subunit TctC